MKAQNRPDNEIPGMIDYLFLKNALKLFEEPPQNLSPDRRMRAEKDAYEELRLQNLVLSSAESVCVTVPAASVEQAIDTIGKRFTDYRDFEENLTVNNLSREDFRRAVKRELLVEAILEHVSRQAPPVEDHDTWDFYINNTENFMVPESRKVKHILITINQDFDDNTRENAYRRIVKIENTLHESPELFEEQATMHSECPSALNGGSLGTVTKGTLLPSLEEILFAMDAPAISPVVESEYGYHLLQCEKIHPEKILGFHEVEMVIHDKLKSAFKSRYIRNWLQQLHSPEE